jgi:ferritin-like metal-binding protein YciE
MRPRTLRCSGSVDLEAASSTSNRLYINEARALIAKGAPVSRKEPAGPKAGFPGYLRETENHVKRLEQVSQLAGLKAQGIDGITKEANEVAGKVEHESVLDAALTAAQAVSTTRSLAAAP